LTPGVLSKMNPGSGATATGSTIV